MRAGVVALLEGVLGPGAVVSRRDRRWLGLADDAVGFVADDDEGWRRLLTEGALARRWRAAGVPVFEVLAEEPAARLQVRRRLRGVTGAEVEPRLFGVDPATVDRYSPAAPLTAFGERLADSYGELAARIAGASSALDGAALGLADHPLPDLDEALQLLAASGVDGAVAERVRACRAWLEAPSPPEVAVHGDLHFHNMVLSEDGAITGVFDLDAAALSTRWTDLQYAPGLGPAFLARVVRAYAAAAGLAVDAEAVRRAHLRVALGHLRWHPRGSPRHDEVVGWVEAAVLALAPRPRYTPRGPLGVGGMGEVWSVDDHHLGRVVARKELHPELAPHGRARALFLDEARIAAQLQHPGIPPVHELGEHPDGRPWFTMKEVRGRTLAEAIEELHAGAGPDGFAEPASGWTFERLVDALARVAEAVGYAHSRGVVHRDLKPANVMLGEHGEVLVLDWGIAKVVGAATGDGPAVTSLRDADPSHRTRMGSVTGTPAYMAPEQADGSLDELGPPTDVYALGATLRDLLVGIVPGRGGPVWQVLPEPPPGAPDELVALCRRATAWDPADRLADGAAFAAEVRAWLEGARRRERAVALADEARSLLARAAAHEEQAAPAQAAGEARLRATPTWAGEDDKAPAWAELDRADALRRSAVRDRLEAEALLDAALTHAPDWRALRSELTSHHLAEHAAAERAGDDVRAERAALRLRLHAATLPPDDPLRRRAERWLRGTGAVTLVTEPPGATVTAHRYVRRGRRWVTAPGLPLGATPLLATQLERGSWLLVVEHPARAPLRVPVELERGGEWTGVPPGDVAPWPLRLPLPGELGPDDVLVPAGWFRVGGDPLASASIPGRRLWCDAFVVRRFPLTNREARALGWPADGPDDHPVVHVDWPGAGELAAREAARTGQPWRLPAELEWEKAGRGVDGRPFPWGDTFEASYACLGDSHAGTPALGPVAAFPHDESPYGVRGLAGNVRDWCADPWRPEGPETPGDRVVAAVTGGPTDWRVRRGGSWGDAPTRGRLADRDWYHPHYRYDYLGVRLVRSAP